MFFAFFVFGHVDQLAALAAATPADTLVINGYRRIGSRNLFMYSTLLFLAVVGLFVPAVFATSGIGGVQHRTEESVLVALVLNEPEVAAGFVFTNNTLLR